MKNFIKLLFVFMIFSLIISGCVVVADPNDIFMYDFGLTGDWGLYGTPSYLTIDNQTGYLITAGKYYVGITEPDWSTISENMGFTSSNLSDNSSRTFQIGNGTAINIGASASATIWIKINSGSDYLVGAFDYESGDDWVVTIYTKN